MDTPAADVDGTGSERPAEGGESPGSGALPSIDAPRRGRLLRGRGSAILLAAVLSLGVGAAGAAVGFRSSGAGSGHPDPSPSTAAPDARSGAAMALDIVHHRTVLFGGRAQTGTALADTWTWDGSTWAKLSPATSPPARSGALLLTTATGLVLTGGVGFDPGPRVCTGTATAGTVTAIGSGSGSAGAGVVLPAANVPAPSTTGPPPPDDCAAVRAPELLSDTWTWDGTTWAPAHPAHPAPNPNGSSASSRDGHDVLVWNLRLQPAIACRAPLPTNSGNPVPPCLPPTVPSITSWTGSDWVPIADPQGHAVQGVTTDVLTGDVAAVVQPTAVPTSADATANPGTFPAICLGPGNGPAPVPPASIGSALPPAPTVAPAIGATALPASAAPPTIPARPEPVMVDPPVCGPGHRPVPAPKSVPTLVPWHTGSWSAPVERSCAVSGVYDREHSQLLAVGISLYPAPQPLGAPGVAGGNPGVGRFVQPDATATSRAAIPAGAPQSPVCNETDAPATVTGETPPVGAQLAGAPGGAVAVSPVGPTLTTWSWDGHGWTRHGAQPTAIPVPTPRPPESVPAQPPLATLIAPQPEPISPSPKALASPPIAPTPPLRGAPSTPPPG